MPEALRALKIRTPAEPEKPQRITLGFGSCTDFPDNHLWTRIARECPDGMVLLGDTPYIDSTDLKWMRWAYRRFASIPQVAEAFRMIPFWATWDDHDFGRNNSNGTLPNKENARQAFAEYRPLRSVGEKGQGA
jgi:alkaline phosphatase D